MIRLPHLLRPLPLAMAVSMALASVSCTPGKPKDAPYSAVTPEERQFEDAPNKPPSCRTLYALSRILAHQGKDDQCAMTLQRLIREHPDYMPAYYDLAELQMRHHRVPQAMQVAQAGLRVSPKDSVLLNNAGMCCLFNQQYVQALERFTQAAAFSPADGRFRANMAVALGLLGRYEEALALYLQVVPPDEAHYNLGVLCEARDDSPRAQNEFEIARGMQPDVFVPGKRASGAGKSSDQ